MLNRNENASFAQIAEIVQLQIKIRKKVQELHYPLQNLLNAYILINSPYLLQALAYFFDGQSELAKYLFRQWMQFIHSDMPDELQQNIITEFKKQISEVLDEYQLGKEEQVLVKTATLCEMVTKGHIDRARVILYAKSFFNQTELQTAFRKCEQALKIKSPQKLADLIDTKNSIVATINGIDELDASWNHLEYLATDGPQQFNLIFAILQLTFGEVAGYGLSHYLLRTYLNYSPLGVLKLISSTSLAHEKWLIPINSNFFLSDDYTIYKSHLQELNDIVDLWQSCFRKYARIVMVLSAIAMAYFPLKETTLIGIISLNIFLSFVLSAGNKIFFDAVEYFGRGRFDELMNQRLMLWNQLSNSLGQEDWILYKKNTLIDSNLNLMIKAARLNTVVGFHQVSATHIRHALIFSLLKYGFSSVRQVNNTIIIGAEQKILPALKDLIVKSCLNYIAEIQKKSAFENTLESMMDKVKLTDQWIPKDNSDIHSLPKFSFHVFLKDSLAKKLHAVLSKVMTPSNITLEQIDEKNMNLSILAVVKMDKADLNQALQMQFQPQFTMTSTSLSLVAMRTAKPYHKKANNETTKKGVSAEVKSKETIEFDFGDYGRFYSSKPEADIIQIRSPFWPRYTHFGLFAVKPEDFNHDPKKFTKYKAIFNKGKLVPSQGHQGIVQNTLYGVSAVTRDWELDTILKVKDPDDKTRVYETEQVKAERAVLHVFGRVSHSH